MVHTWNGGSELTRRGLKEVLLDIIFKIKLHYSLSLVELVKYLDVKWAS